ncbi:hypothetical protein ACUNV4_17350 [Granulosicoccus sp. 3-233]|uniref:hypothetical protein n=1 Tax=Granulosicoccus sp. 3-233 TaxID=3417969 RepID=UPI003D356F10
MMSLWVKDPALTSIELLCVLVSFYFMLGLFLNTLSMKVLTIPIAASARKDFDATIENLSSSEHRVMQDTLPIDLGWVNDVWSQITAACQVIRCLTLTCHSWGWGR